MLLCLPPLLLCLSLFDAPKFFQLRIIIFPGMSRRCFPIPSRRRLSRGNSFRGFLSRTQPRARLLPHPFPGSSTQKNFNSTLEKSRITARFFFSLSRFLAWIRTSKKSRAGPYRGGYKICDKMPLNALPRSRLFHTKKVTCRRAIMLYYIYLNNKIKTNTQAVLKLVNCSVHEQHSFVIFVVSCSRSSGRLLPLIFNLARVH